MRNTRSLNILRAAIAATLGTCAAPLAFAQDQAAAPPADENIDEVVVTGTRVATRTRYESLSPVDVLPAATIEKQGTTELAEALSTVAPSLDQYLNVIRTAGGSVEKLDVWGRRRLSFEINKKAEGIYAVVDLQATPEAVAELDRQLRLNENILRTKVIRPETR